jgi:hypothetical protein
VCVCVCVCVCARAHVRAFVSVHVPAIIPRHQLSKDVISVTNAQGTMQEVLDASFSIRFVSYKRKVD